MTLFRTLLVLLLWPSLLWASDDLPALYDVTGVASDDTLNIRAEPSGGAQKQGELLYDAKGIEVTAHNTDSTWGRVNTGEVSGWVSLRYLAAQPRGDYALVREMRCFGTEPFWDLMMVQGQWMRLGTPEGKDVKFHAGLLQSASGHPHRFSIRGSGDKGVLVGVIRRQQCSDGMSDRLYGLEIDAVLDDSHFTGCCTLISD